MSLVHFMRPDGLTTAISPASVGAVQDDFHSPGRRYEPGCTVFLNSGEQLRLRESAATVIRKLYPPEGTPR